MKSIKIFLVLLGSVVTEGVSQSADTTKDIILKAMLDELSRSIHELKLQDHDKPFFILYNIGYNEGYTLGASGGGIIAENEGRDLSKGSIRVLVGDYSFNDESLASSGSSSRTAREIALPNDPTDYIGIRRALWSTTNDVYYGAAEAYANNQKEIKAEGKELKEVPHRTFAKSDPVTVIQTLTPGHIDKKKWGTIIKNLSARLSADTLVENSRVFLLYNEGYTYTTTTEGTVARLPHHLSSIVFVVSGKNEKGEISLYQKILLASTDAELPSEKELMKEGDNALAELGKLLHAPALEETYNGPVLFLGQPVAAAFCTTFFGGRDNLYYKDAIEKIGGAKYSQEATLESKIGKNVVSESITIKTKPHLKNFQGTSLLGSFDLDAEGIVPVPLTLIEGGVLKNLLNNRTLTTATQESNGYNAALGVVEITVKQSDSEKDLRTKLLSEAKKQGLDFAIIVKEMPAFGGFMNVYKVSVADGKEVLVRNVNPASLTIKSYKKLLGASGNLQAYNLSGGVGRTDGAVRSIASFIVPDAMLLGDVELKPFQMPLLKEEEYVSRPK